MFQKGGKKPGRNLKDMAENGKRYGKQKMAAGTPFKSGMGLKEMAGGKSK